MAAARICFGRFPLTDWVTYSILEFWANVAMFVPVGLFFLLLLGRRRWWLAIVLGVVLTCAIEFVQKFLPDRVSDPRDILANSVGAFVGVVAALVVTWPAAVRRARERRLRRARPDDGAGGGPTIRAEQPPATRHANHQVPRIRAYAASAGA